MSVQCRQMLLRSVQHFALGPGHLIHSVQATSGRLKDEAKETFQ